MKDNIAHDLATIIKNTQNKLAFTINNDGRLIRNTVIDDADLLERLVLFIASRDAKVFDHAYKMGREAHNCDEGRS